MISIQKIYGFHGWNHQINDFLEWFIAVCIWRTLILQRKNTITHCWHGLQYWHGLQANNGLLRIMPITNLSGIVTSSNLNSQYLKGFKINLFSRLHLLGSNGPLYKTWNAFWGEHKYWKRPIAGNQNIFYKGSFIKIYQRSAVVMTLYSKIMMSPERHHSSYMEGKLSQPGSFTFQLENKWKTKLSCMYGGDKLRWGSNYCLFRPKILPLFPPQRHLSFSSTQPLPLPLFSAQTMCFVPYTIFKAMYC